MALKFHWFGKKKDQPKSLSYKNEYYSSVHDMLGFSQLNMFLNEVEDLSEILKNIKTHISYVQSGNKIIHLAHARYISTINELIYVLCLDQHNSFIFCTESEIETGKYKPVVFELYEPSADNETDLIFDKPVTGNAVADIFKHIIILGLIDKPTHKAFIDKIISPIIKHTRQSLDLVNSNKIQLKWFNSQNSIQIEQTIKYIDALKVTNISAKIFLKSMLDTHSMKTEQFDQIKTITLNIYTFMNALKSLELNWNSDVNKTISESEKLLNALASIVILRKWAKNDSNHVQTLMVDFLNENFYKRCKDVSKKLFGDLKINADEKTSLANKLIVRKGETVHKVNVGSFTTKAASDLLDEIIKDLENV